MKNNQLTIMALIFVVLLIFGGWLLYQNNTKTFEYNGQSYKPGESFLAEDGCNTCSFSTDGQIQCTLMACEDDLGRADPAGVNITFEYLDGKYIYSGTVQKPTPCHELQTEVFVRESFPEQVDLNLTIVDSGEICIQVIDEEGISGEIAVSEGAVVRVFLNGVELGELGVN